MRRRRALPRWLSSGYVSQFVVEAEVHAVWIPATLALLEKFMRSEAR